MITDQNNYRYIEFCQVLTRSIFIIQKKTKSNTHTSKTMYWKDSNFDNINILYICWYLLINYMSHNTSALEFRLRNRIFLCLKYFKLQYKPVCICLMHFIVPFIHYILTPSTTLTMLLASLLEENALQSIINYSLSIW